MDKRHLGTMRVSTIGLGSMGVSHAYASTSPNKTASSAVLPDATERFITCIGPSKAMNPALTRGMFLGLRAGERG